MGPTTVRFAATAVAVAGTPQLDVATGIDRVSDGANAGPPRGPFALRVSSTRQGVTMTKLEPTTSSVARHAPRPRVQTKSLRPSSTVRETDARGIRRGQGWQQANLCSLGGQIRFRELEAANACLVVRF